MSDFTRLHPIRDECLARHSNEHDPLILITFLAFSCLVVLLSIEKSNNSFLNVYIRSLYHPVLFTLRYKTIAEIKLATIWWLNAATVTNNIDTPRAYCRFNVGPASVTFAQH